MHVMGLDKTEITILKMLQGSTGKQRYGDIGFLVSSLSGFRLPENQYRPHFMKLCRWGLITWISDAEGKKHFKDRIFKITKKGNELVRDVQIHYGGDYSFYRNFESNGSNLDKYLGKKITVSNTEADVAVAKGMMTKAMREEIRYQHALERKAKKLRFYT